MGALALRPLGSSPGALSGLKWLQLDLGRPRAVSLFPGAALEKQGSLLPGLARTTDLKDARLLGRAGMGQEAGKRELAPLGPLTIHAQLPSVVLWVAFESGRNGSRLHSAILFFFRMRTKVEQMAS